MMMMDGETGGDPQRCGIIGYGVIEEHSGGVQAPSRYHIMKDSMLM